MDLTRWERLGRFLVLLELQRSKIEHRGSEETRKNVCHVLDDWVPAQGKMGDPGDMRKQRLNEVLVLLDI